MTQQHEVNGRFRDLSLSSERGAALMITLMVMLLVFVLGSALTTSMLTEVTSSANYRSRGEALWQADSGLERVAVDLLADPTWARNMVDFSTLPMVVANPFPASSTINGTTVTYTSDGMGGIVAQYYDFGAAVTLDSGTFTRQIFMPPTSLTIANGTGTKAWLMIPVGATGSSGGAEASTATLRSDMRIGVRRLTVWDNALFGGAGQAGNAINGNVEIRGSVHIIGDPTNTVDQGGTAAVMNNYRDANTMANFGADWTKLPTLPTVTLNGEVVETLGAEVRVKYGTIDLGGSVEWGEVDATGNTYKEELDGFYSDASLTLSGSAAVNPEDTGGYDADGLGFPSLDDPYYDAGAAVLWASHRAYLDNTALTIPETEISDNVASFSYTDGAGNSIDWDNAAATLTIEGIVRIAGDLDLSKKNFPVAYEGTGTLFSTGDIDIHGDVLPTTDYLDTAAPTVNNLGLIADDDMHLATGPGESQIKVMAALYAEGQTQIAKQTTVAGSVVTNFFDLGNQVPSIFQVPALSSNLPPGLPGADPMLFVNGADITNWYHARQ